MPSDETAATDEAVILDALQAYYDTTGVTLAQVRRAGGDEGPFIDLRVRIRRIREGLFHA